MSEDSNPSRQAYSNTSTNGYKGRFVGNICNIRLFKENPYILDLTESQRDTLNANLLEPYNGELFYDDDKFIWVCEVTENESTGEKTYHYKSQEKELNEKLKYYESKGVMNQLMSAYNNGQVYKFYYNSGSNLLHPNPTLVFPNNFISYRVRRQGLNANNSPVYVAGSVVDGHLESVNIGMKLVNDTVAGTTYRRMGTAQIFTSTNVTNGYAELENGKFYVVEFFDNDSNLVGTRLFQAVASAGYDASVPSSTVVDLKIAIYRNGIDLKSSSNTYQIYAGEDLTKSVSYSVIAVYDDGTEKVITDKLDTPCLTREGWDVDTNGAPEGSRFKVTFTYFPRVDENGDPIGTSITRDIYFQVTAYQYSKIIKAIPIVWSDNDTDLSLNNNSASKTYKLKLYTLSSDGVVENRTRSFYNSMCVVDEEGAAHPVTPSNFNAIYSFDPYNQCVSFTFVSTQVASMTAFDFTMYNNGITDHYRFKVAFGKEGSNGNSGQTVSSYTFVEAYNNNISEYGYGAGGIFEYLTQTYHIIESSQKYNKARIFTNASGGYEIELNIVETDTYIRDAYARIINGVSYKPNKIILYSVKDQTVTPLTPLTALNSTATKIQIPAYVDTNVSNIIRNIDQFDYIIAQFHNVTESDDNIINIGVFSAVKEAV